MLQKLDHFTIPAKNPKALAEWYENILGLKIILEMKRKGRGPLFYVKPKKGSLIEIVPADYQIHLSFEVDDFDEALKDLTSKGVVFTEVREASIGWKVGFFKDPEGNLVELVCRGEKHLPRRFESFTAP